MAIRRAMASCLLLAAALSWAGPHEVHELQRETALLRETTAAQVQAVRSESAREQAVLAERMAQVEKVVDMLAQRVDDVGFWIAFYQDLWLRYMASTEPAIERLVVEGASDWVHLRTVTGDPAGAERIRAQIQARYGASTDTEVKHWVGESQAGPSATRSRT